ncbi:hypothetical protein QE250_16005 [Chromatiaceae bacterium AAb-1]|nr:hypothetical protein [Chromatiaceae bacterium AAb-1]
METNELQVKLSQFNHLLPSQHDLLERLLFQLAFNRFRHIRLAGHAGSGKSTLILAIAELFSEQMNVAMLTLQGGPAQTEKQLMHQWFGLEYDELQPLTEQVTKQAQETAPLLLLVDDFDMLSEDTQLMLQSLPVLLISSAEQNSADADLNLSVPAVSMLDAEQLLVDNLNPLILADRLVQADGNLHVLLNPPFQEEEPVTTPKPLPASVIGVACLIFLLLLAAVIFWPSDSTEQSATPIRQPAVIPVAEETPVQPEPELTAPQEESATEHEELGAEPTQPEVLIPVIPEPVLIVAEQAATAEKSSENPAQEKPASADTVSYQYDEARFLAMSPQQLALQLAVFSKAETEQRFLETYPDLPVLRYQRSWQGKTQIVVLLAPYEDAAAAKEQQQALPEALRGSGLFVKPVKAIQSEIDAYQHTLANKSGH